MKHAWLLLLFLLPGGSVMLTAAALFRRLGRRREAWRRRLSTLYLRSLVACCGGRPERCGFPLIDRPGARMALVEAMAGLQSVTCGCEAAVLRSISRRYGLEELLLRKLRRPFADRRRLLALLALLPLHRATAGRLDRYAVSRQREVRFYALMARLAADPDGALTRLRDFADPLTPFECSEVMTLVRRGVLPLSYEKLLRAPETNLRRLGVRIVRHFGIERAVPQLLLLASDPLLRREVLETLCDLHMPFRGAAVRAGRALTDEERRSLLRRAAYEGYALSGIEQLLRGDERRDFERMAATYKSSVLWS